jgi:hypothetical protein
VNGVRCCAAAEKVLYWRVMKPTIHAFASRLPVSALLAGLLLRVRAR